MESDANNIDWEIHHDGYIAGRQILPGGQSE